MVFLLLNNSFSFCKIYLFPVREVYSSGVSLICVFLFRQACLLLNLLLFVLVF